MFNLFQISKSAVELQNKKLEYIYNTFWGLKEKFLFLNQGYLVLINLHSEHLTIAEASHMRTSFHFHFNMSRINACLYIYVIPACYCLSELLSFRVKYQW